MNEENKDKLYRSFPDLYEQLKEDDYYFFTCHDGWFDLLWRISEYVTKAAEKQGLEPRVVQIKEKFGELRFYMVGSNRELHQSVQKLCDESQHICERCGQPGSFRVTGAGYWCVRCPACLLMEAEQYRQRWGGEQSQMTPEEWMARNNRRFSDSEPGDDEP
ncbi:MAG: hypothetical protein KZQ58_00415 [gamma proteobacterium symbiont of Bathyaustriella thionipta]|nr:hypothetical protein [gamma proteobacterium symbiont of Bathyaustriella thionipta]